jgi:hypothetical protein
VRAAKAVGSFAVVNDENARLTHSSIFGAARYYQAIAHLPRERSDAGEGRQRRGAMANGARAAVPRRRRSRPRIHARGHEVPYRNLISA